MIKILLPSKCLKNISQHHCSETCPVSVTSPRSSSMESTSLKKPTPSHPADAQLNWDLVTGLAAVLGEINTLSCLWCHSYTALAFWQRSIILLTKKRKNKPICRWIHCFSREEHMIGNDDQIVCIKLGTPNEILTIKPVWLRPNMMDAKNSTAIWKQNSQCLEISPTSSWCSCFWSSNDQMFFCPLFFNKASLFLAPCCNMLPTQAFRKQPLFCTRLTSRIYKHIPFKGESFVWWVHQLKCTNLSNFKQASVV